MRIYTKALGLSIFVAGLSYLIVTFDLIRIDTSVLEVFFSVFGTIYAIMVGFVIMVLLNQYSTIKDHIGSEINALQDLRDYLVYLDNNDRIRADIKDRIKEYVESVIETEWPQMVGTGKVDTDTSPELYAIMEAIHEIKPTNQSDIVALDKLIDTVGCITTYRTDRLYACSEKLPPLLKNITMFLSFSLVIIFLGLSISNPALKMLLSAVMTFAISLIESVLVDLDNPFKGDWCITSEAFGDLLKKF